MKNRRQKKGKKKKKKKMKKRISKTDHHLFYFLGKLSAFSSLFFYHLDCLFLFVLYGTSENRIEIFSSTFIK